MLKCRKNCMRNKREKLHPKSWSLLHVIDVTVSQNCTKFLEQMMKMSTFYSLFLSFVSTPHSLSHSPCLSLSLSISLSLSFRIPPVMLSKIESLSKTLLDDPVQKKKQALDEFVRVEVRYCNTLKSTSFHLSSLFHLIYFPISLSFFLFFLSLTLLMCFLVRFFI
jgi:hypothetical protein